MCVLWFCVILNSFSTVFFLSFYWINIGNKRQSDVIFMDMYDSPFQELSVAAPADEPPLFSRLHSPHWSQYTVHREAQRLQGLQRRQPVISETISTSQNNFQPSGGCKMLECDSVATLPGLCCTTPWTGRRRQPQRRCAVGWLYA